MGESSSHRPLGRDEIEAAAARIARHVRRTPVLDPGPNAFGVAAALNFKLEFLQHAGSFKTRGAFNSLLAGTVPAAGVTAASGGNHGAAVAYAARKLGLRARVFVPEIASPAKVELIRRHGADLLVTGARYADAQAACDDFAAETGALVVHPFAGWDTMAGQGTVAREWDQQEPDLDTVLVAVGGGGLVSGMAAWWAKDRRVRMVGVEPEGSRALHAALEAGGPVDVPVESVAADSLGARNVGSLVYAAASVSVDHVAIVPDAAILEAQRVLWRELRIAAEPGGAAALAALVSGAYRPARDERVGVLLCGANLDGRALSEIAR